MALNETTNNNVVQIKNTRTFLLQDNVTALFGYVGAPTSKVAVPLATQNKIIYFGAFTGAGFLSDHQTNPYSFSLRASYDTEIESMVRHLKDDLNITKIGLFVQRDAFGLAERCKSFKNVYISQVVPNPWDPQVPVVKEYQGDMAEETYGFISLEAYIAAKTFNKAFNNAGATPSSDAIKASPETMSDYDVGGLKVSFGASDHRGLDQTYLTKIEKDGDQFKFVYVDKLVLEE